MSLKYNCNLCNYYTNSQGNYNKHISTNKHKKQVKNKNVDSKNGIIYSKNGIINSKNGIDNYNCKHCTKKYSAKYNLNKHMKKCKEKIKYADVQKILDEKEQLEKDKLKLEKEKIEFEKTKEQLNDLNEDYKELEKEYNEFLKKTANNFMENNSKNITNNNISNCNMYYIINNFTDAPNFKNQINEQLTDSEKKKIMKSGPIDGVTKLINMKCIKDKEINKRSIHCVDSARKKFVVRENDNWQIDIKGKKILTISIPITKDIFEKDYDYENINDPFLKSTIINKLIQLEQKAGHIKIINDLSDDTLLKNNIEQ